MNKYKMASASENRRPKTFLAYLWLNTKLFWLFWGVIVIGVFHIGGHFISGMTFKDMLPFYCIMSAIGLTFIVYYSKQWRQMKQEEREAEEEFKALDEPNDPSKEM